MAEFFQPRSDVGIQPRVSEAEPWVTNFLRRFAVLIARARKSADLRKALNPSYVLGRRADAEVSPCIHIPSIQLRSPPRTKSNLLAAERVSALLDISASMPLTY